MTKRVKSKEERIQFWIAIIIMIVAFLYAGWQAISSIDKSLSSSNLKEIVEALTQTVNEDSIVTYPISDKDTYEEHLASIGITASATDQGYTYIADTLDNTKLLDCDLGRLIDNEIKLNSKFNDISIRQLQITVNDDDTITFDTVLKLDISLEEFGNLTYYIHYINTLNQYLGVLQSNIRINNISEDLTKEIISIIDDTISSTKLTIDKLFSEIFVNYIEHFTTILSCNYTFESSYIVLNK